MTGIELIAAERDRQQSALGYDAAHDDAYVQGEIASAAASYLDTDLYDAALVPSTDGIPNTWPWEAEHWKPGSYVRNLVKAGALIAAELDRAMRATTKGKQ